MQTYDFILGEFLSLNTPINRHYLDRYIKFVLAANPVYGGEYGECHHILPNSLFPAFRSKKFAPWNFKKINARSHYICHWMLWKALPGNQQMSAAFWGISNQDRGGRTYRINAQTYAKARDEWVIRSRKINAAYKLTDEGKSTAKRQSEAMKKYGQTEEGRKQNSKNGSANFKKRWVENRGALLEQVRSIWDDEHKTKQSQTMKEKQNRPWKHPLADMTLYARLDEIFDVWVSNQTPGYVNLARILNITDRKSKNAITYFRKHGDPRLDDDWISEFK